MIANAAFLAGLSPCSSGRLAGGGAGFLAPYKAALFRQHGWFLGGVALVLFFNLCALYYSVARWLFLRDSGRKLLHLDRQLGTSDAALDDLGPHLES